jgi:predicted nucleic acid-binding protein
MPTAHLLISVPSGYGAYKFQTETLPNFLLDTNVVSEARRKTPDAKVVAWVARADPADLFISALTLGEIAKGVAMRAKQSPAQAEGLEQWLIATRVSYADRIVAIDADIAETWGRLDARRTLPIVEGLLAATALIRGMTLVTRNARDVADAGIPVLNPWNS